MQSIPIKKYKKPYSGMNEYINAANKKTYIQAVNVVSYTKRGYLEEKKKKSLLLACIWYCGPSPFTWREFSCNTRHSPMHRAGAVSHKADLFLISSNPFKMWGTPPTAYCALLLICIIWWWWNFLYAENYPLIPAICVRYFEQQDSVFASLGLVFSIALC